MVKPENMPSSSLSLLSSLARAVIYVDSTLVVTFWDLALLVCRTSILGFSSFGVKDFILRCSQVTQLFLS